MADIKPSYSQNLMIIFMFLFIRVMRRENTYAASSMSNSSVVVCTRSQMFPSCAASWFKMCDLLQSPAISSDFSSATLSNFFKIFARAASFSSLKSFLQSWRSFLIWFARRLFQQSILYWLIGNFLFNWSPKRKPRNHSPIYPPTAPTGPPKVVAHAPPVITPCATASPAQPASAPKKPKRESLNHVW